MKKVILVTGVVWGLATLNARIDAAKECRCGHECWCKKRGFRHFRWLVPLGHTEFQPGRTQGTEAVSAQAPDHSDM